MTCSYEEVLARRQQARGLGLFCSVDFAWFPDCGAHAIVHIPTLVVSIGVDSYGPFATIEEAVSMLILLGGGPK